MKSELHTFLISCDIKDAWEYPPDVDWEKSIAEIENLKPELERILGVELQLDDQIQDASFFADLGLLTEQSSSNGSVILSYQVCFRFSWFSKLFTIFGDQWEKFDTSEIIELLRNNDFVYIPLSELDAPYDGVNQPYEKGITWWVRYFDYL